MSCQNVTMFLPKTFLLSFYLKCSKTENLRGIRISKILKDHLLESIYM